MTFDKQEHKEAVLALLQQATFPGHLLELALELKQAVTDAGVSNGAAANPDAPAATTRRKRLT